MGNAFASRASVHGGNLKRVSAVYKVLAWSIVDLCIMCFHISNSWNFLVAQRFSIPSRHPYEKVTSLHRTSSLMSKPQYLHPTKGYPQRLKKLTQSTWTKSKNKKIAYNSKVARITNWPRFLCTFGFIEICFPVKIKSACLVYHSALYSTPAWESSQYDLFLAKWNRQISHTSNVWSR